VEVAAGSASEAEIDAAGVEGFKGAELFGDDEGSVVGQHDAAASDADGAGGSRDMADENRRCGAGKAGDGMMFGQPEALIAPLLSSLSEMDGPGDGAARRLAGAHADEIEYGNCQVATHGYWMSERAQRCEGRRRHGLWMRE